MPNYQSESFYRATTRQSILSDTAVPFSYKVSQVPTLTTWLLTISPNTANEEIVEYDGIDASTLTITITKRWIKPSSILLTTNWVDYNNVTYQKSHSQNDSIRWDVNHIHINQGIGNSTLATNLWVGISKLSVAAVDPGNPIVVWDNDPRLTNNIAVGRITLTNTTTTLTTYTLWFRPKVVKLTATLGSAEWPTSSSITYDWSQTITVYWVYNATNTDVRFRHDTQPWSAVLLRTSDSSSLINITTVWFISTWFTLSAPNWTWYTTCSITYEAFA